MRIFRGRHRTARRSSETRICKHEQQKVEESKGDEGFNGGLGSNGKQIQKLHAFDMFSITSAAIRGV